MSNYPKILSVRYSSNPASRGKSISVYQGRTTELYWTSASMKYSPKPIILCLPKADLRVVEIEDDCVVGGELQRCSDWELCLDDADLASVLTSLEGKFDIDSEAREALIAAVSANHLVMETTEELFAWQKRRDRQRGPIQKS